MIIVVRSWVVGRGRQGAKQRQRENKTGSGVDLWNLKAHPRDISSNKAIPSNPSETDPLTGALGPRGPILFQTTTVCMHVWHKIKCLEFRKTRGGCQIFRNWSCEQMVVSHYLCAGNWTSLATRTTGALNHWTISPVPQFFFFIFSRQGFFV